MEHERGLRPHPQDEGERDRSAFARGLPIDEYPNLLAMAEMVTTAQRGVPVDFAFGLDLILDGLERLREAAGS